MDKYQNMLWEQLEDQFGTSPVPTRTPRPAPTPKHSQKLSPRLRSKPRFTSVSTLRPRPTPVLTRISKWWQWKNNESFWNKKENNETNNNITRDYHKLVKSNGAFDEKHTEYVSKGDANEKITSWKVPGNN